MSLLGGLFQNSRQKIESTRDELRQSLKHQLEVLRRGDAPHDADDESTGIAFRNYCDARAHCHGTTTTLHSPTKPSISSA